LGTGGAIKNAREIVSSDTFFVLNGDCFLPIDFKAFADFHADKKAVVSMVIAPASQAKDFGTVKMDGSGRILDFSEKTEEGEQPLVSAGIYCFDQTVFSLMPNEENFSLEMDLFPTLAGKDFFGYKSQRQFVDIGTPQRYESLKKAMEKGKRQ